MPLDGEGAMAYTEDRLSDTEQLRPAEPWLGAWLESFLHRYTRASESERASLRDLLAALDEEIGRAQALRARERAN